MKVLVIGSNGQLGREMQKQLKANSTAYDAVDVPDIDISDPTSIDKRVRKSNCNVIVNCAAYTNVDGAETDYDNAYKINASASKYLAMACAKYDIEFIHVSTDYVFSGEGILQNGKKRPYIETDECLPNTVYGKTKLAGEVFIQENHDKYYILRTAWLYGDGNNFVKAMLKLSEDRDELCVVNDQYGSPTSTVDLAAVIIRLIGSKKYGMYHATCEGVGTWYDFARKIFDIKGMDVSIKPISSDEFVRAAQRPMWSVLENRHLDEHGCNTFRYWEDALEEYLMSVGSEEKQ